MKQDNKNEKPLYKVLNEQRTQGYLKVDYGHKKTPLTLAVGNLNTGLDWEEVGSAWKENDAKYLCMAYNNLTSLADALKNLIDDIEACKRSGINPSSTLLNIAKEKLSKIS